MLIYFFSILLILPAAAQVGKGPLSLAEIEDFVSDVDQVGKEDDLIGALKRNGLGFELDEAALTTILLKNVARTPQANASLLAQMFRECSECFIRSFSPLNHDQLLLLLKENDLRPQISQKKIQLRGTKDIPKTAEFVAELSKMQVPPTLIDLIVPEDEILVATPPLYERKKFDRATEYDRNLPNGTISLIVKVTGKADFFFLRNALFAKTEPMEPEKKARGKVKTAPVISSVEVVMGTFNAPIPASSRIAEFEMFNILDKPAIKSQQKINSQPTFTYEGGGIKFTISDRDTHLYEIKIKYQTPQTPQMK